MLFVDRVDAGRKLAEKLTTYRGKETVVLAIPRGGVIVGAVVAETLGGVLDIILPRKIGLPANPEVAIGAVAEDGALYLAPELTAYFDVDEAYLKEAAAAEQEEIRRRRALYTTGRPHPVIRGKTAILVDDGIATGFTTRAALVSLRQQSPAELVLAVPVAPPDVFAGLSKEVDAAVCVATPAEFVAVGQFYRDFAPVPDTAVLAALAAAGMISHPVAHTNAKKDGAEVK